MKDRQKIFLDKITKLIVDDTRIDYDMGRIYFPFPPLSSFLLHFFCLSLTLSSPSLSFSDYCRNQFGLTDKEIKYVWDQYKSIIKDKISKRES